MNVWNWLFETALKKKIFLARKNIFFEGIHCSGKSEWVRIEIRSVIKFLVSQKWKQSEVYRMMRDAQE